MQRAMLVLAGQDCAPPELELVPAGRAPGSCSEERVGLAADCWPAVLGLLDSPQLELEPVAV